MSIACLFSFSILYTNEVSKSLDDEKSLKENITVFCASIDFQISIHTFFVKALLLSFQKVIEGLDLVLY